MFSVCFFFFFICTFVFSLTVRNSQKQITVLPRDQEKKTMIASKLICLYCSTRERADRGRKSGKSITLLCLPPPTIRTPTLPLCSGLQELSAQDSLSNQRGHRHLTNHTSNQCKHHKAPLPIKQLLSLVLSSLPILPRLANQLVHWAERQTGRK